MKPTTKQRQAAAAKIVGTHWKDEAAREQILAGASDDHPLVQAEVYYHPDVPLAPPPKAAKP